MEHIARQKHWLTCIVCLLFPVFTIGQEGESFRYPSWTAEDTAAIKKLLLEGQHMLHISPDSALSLFKQAEQQSRSVGFSDGIGYALSHMGSALTYLGDYKNGFSCYQQAMPYCLTAQYFTASLPVLYVNIGNSYMASGDMEQSNKYYYQALQYFRKHLPGDTKITAVYANLAMVQGRLGNYPRAMYYAQQAVQMADNTGKPVYQIPAYINIGAIYLLLENGDSALYYFQKGLDMARTEGYTEMQQSALTNIGGIEMDRGKPEDAIPYFLQALQLSDAASPLYGSITPGYALGAAYYRTKEYDKGETILLASLAKAKQTGLQVNIHHAHKALADIYETAGRYKEALEQRHLYEQLKDSLSGVDKTRAISELDVKYKAAEKDKIIAQHQLEIIRQHQKIEQDRMLTAGAVIFALLITSIVLLIYRYQRRIARRKEELEHMKAKAEGEEKERKRIARELHDGVGGIITSVKLNLDTLRYKKTVTHQDIDGLAELVHEVGNEVQRTAHNLMADILEEQDLCHALLAYCDHINMAGQIETDVQAYGDMGKLDSATALSLYRIAQELIQNAVKYSGASLLSVQLRHNEATGKFYLSVEDNGSGYDTTASHSGLGLKNIKERVNMLNGDISIESAPGMGTAVVVQIDLQNKGDRNHSEHPYQWTTVG